MSVIQISKIQLRRGRKLSGNGIPQLSSAEMAWSIDTQELFIGNGSINEGSPYVGNTRIITEHDNLIELSNGYRYESDDPSINYSVNRSIQNKLDDFVNVLDYGAIPDGITDCTDNFHNAFAELFDNPNFKYKKILVVPNGRYVFTKKLYIPSTVILQGENKLQTILVINDNNIEFIIDPNIPEVGENQYPCDIVLSNLTIEHTTGKTVITASQECKFDQVRWMSNYQLSDQVFVPENANAVYDIPSLLPGGYIKVTGPGVSIETQQDFSNTLAETISSMVSLLNADLTFMNEYSASIIGSSLKITTLVSTYNTSALTTNFTVSYLMDSDSTFVETQIQPILTEYTDGSQNVMPSVYWDNILFGTRTHNIDFNNCEFISTPLAIRCSQQQEFDTTINFENCKFYVCDTGVYVEGVVNQRNNWKFKDCVFDQISGQALNITNGTGIRVYDTSFINCGNGSSISQYPISPIIKFGQNQDNILINCSSDRHRNSSIVSASNISGVLETMPSIIEFENVSLASLVDRNYSTVIKTDNYTLLSILPARNNSITIDYILTLGTHSRTGKLTLGTDTSNNYVSLVDNYIYSTSNAFNAISKPAIVNFEFNAELRDNNIDGNNETVLLKYKNPQAFGDTGSISYSITYGS